MVLFIATLPMTMAYIFEIFGSSVTLSSPYITLISNSFGFFNALVYGYLRKVHRLPKDYSISLQR